MAQKGGAWESHPLSIFKSMKLASTLQKSARFSKHLFWKVHSSHSQNRKQAAKCYIIASVWGMLYLFFFFYTPHLFPLITSFYICALIATGLSLTLYLQTCRSGRRWGTGEWVGGRRTHSCRSWRMYASKSLSHPSTDVPLCISNHAANCLLFHPNSCALTQIFTITDSVKVYFEAK